MLETSLRTPSTDRQLQPTAPFIAFGPPFVQVLSLITHVQIVSCLDNAQLLGERREPHPAAVTLGMAVP